MLFKEIIVVYMKHVNNFCEKNADLLKVKKQVVYINTTWR